MTLEGPFCYSVISLQPGLHDINKELSCISHCHAQRLAWGSELRWHRGEVSSWWSPRCCCRQMLWLGGKARWAINQARSVGYWVWVGAAVADRAADAPLTGGSYWALTGSSMAPYLWFTATASRLTSLVLTAVGATASCRQKRRCRDCCQSTLIQKIMFICWTEPLISMKVEAKWCRQYSTDPVCGDSWELYD